MRIAAIIPTYNRPGELLRALLSVVNQTRQPDEICIVGDGCDPLAWKLVELFSNFTAARHNIGFFMHNLDAGGGPFGWKARNVGIQNSTSELIAYLDDDNEWFPRHLELLEKKLVETNADLVWCGFILIPPKPFTDRHIPRDVPPGASMYSEIESGEILHTRKALDLMPNLETGIWWQRPINGASGEECIFVDRLRTGGAKCVPLAEPLEYYYWGKHS